jgi:hypothetical protein
MSRIDDLPTRSRGEGKAPAVGLTTPNFSSVDALSIAPQHDIVCTRGHRDKCSQHIFDASLSLAWCSLTRDSAAASGVKRRGLFRCPTAALGVAEPGKIVTLPVRTLRLPTTSGQIVRVEP